MLLNVRRLLPYQNQHFISEDMDAVLQDFWRLYIVENLGLRLSSELYYMHTELFLGRFDFLIIPMLNIILFINVLIQEFSRITWVYNKMSS